MLRSWFPSTTLPRESPTRGASSTDRKNADGISDPESTFRVVLFQYLGKCVMLQLLPTTSSSRRRRTRPSPAPGNCQATTPLSRKQRFLLVQERIGLSCDALAIFALIDDVVVKTLADKHTVCNAEINRDCDDHRHETSPSSADEVADVTYEPDENEDERNSFSRAIAVVFDQLRDLNMSVVCKSDLGRDQKNAHEEENPAGQTYGTEHSR